MYTTLPLLTEQSFHCERSNPTSHTPPPFARRPCTNAQGPHWDHPIALWKLLHTLSSRWVLHSCSWAAEVGDWQCCTALLPPLHAPYGHQGQRQSCRPPHTAENSDSPHRKAFCWARRFTAGISWGDAELSLPGQQGQRKRQWIKLPGESCSVVYASPRTHQRQTFTAASVSPLQVRPFCAGGTVAAASGPT